MNVETVEEVEKEEDLDPEVTIDTDAHRIIIVTR